MGFGVVLIQRFRFYLLSVLSECGRLSSREIRNKHQDSSLGLLVSFPHAGILLLYRNFCMQT